MPVEVSLAVPEMFNEEFKFKPDCIVLKGNETKKV